MNPVSEGVFRVVSPMPAPLEAVNLYVLRLEEGLGLVDTGIRSKRSLACLEAALEGDGAALSEIRHVIVTHAHVDHGGLAAAIAEKSGATIHAHEETCRLLAAAVEVVADHPALPFFLSLGLPREVAERMLSVEGYMLSRMLEPVSEVRPLGSELLLAPFRFGVVETPGHCPGHVALVEEERRFLLCGDALHAERLPPCPLPLYPARACSLDELVAEMPQDGFVRSLAALRGLGSLRHLPGHGPPFEDSAPVRASYARKIEERLRRVHEACREPASVFALSEVLFGARAGVVTWLTASETLSAAVALLRQGALVARERGGTILFERSGPFELPGAWR